MKRIALLGMGGVGDLCLLAVAADILKTKGYAPIALLFTRDDVFNPFYSLFGQDFEIKQFSDSLLERGLIDPEYFRTLWKPYADEGYIVFPDLLYWHPQAFDYQKFGTHPLAIRNRRILQDRWKPEKRIYVSPFSSTPGYTYQELPKLLKLLGESLPDYEIFCPLVKRWANVDIQESNFNTVVLPKNVNCPEDTFSNCLEVLSRSCYFIGGDGGFSHVASLFSIPRLLLDPYYGATLDHYKFIARWREDISESVPVQSIPEEITKIVKTNLEISQTCLLPRICILNTFSDEWEKLLLRKY